ncbi:alpha/beta-hydrolase [Phaeosphaeriaceae sp. SRC1lsM3a]|nr:alpha/beta-hydrolase [Stagonospora sp. SRC1lsM3a]
MTPQHPSLRSWDSHTQPSHTASPAPNSASLPKTTHQAGSASKIPSSTPHPPAHHCLTLSIHLPPSAFHLNSTTLNTTANLPVLIFIHGGAFFLGSGNRPYYSPASLLLHSLSGGKDVIYVAINYRLGSLGYQHATTSNDSMPPNNGLYDQIRALEWVKAHIGGFGGDVGNISVLGQSAGGESISLLSHAEEVVEKNLFQRAIMFSGTPVTMPALTAEDHTSNFLSQAEKAGVDVKNSDGSERAVEDVVRDMQSLPVDAIRDLAWVGLPCTSTPLLPFPRPTMESAKKRKRTGKGVQAQLVSTTTYDGGISFNMMSRDSSRHSHAADFMKIANDVLGPEHASALCDIYAISESTPDPEALQRICLFESDIGFFFAALAVCEAGAHLVPKTYFQIFDLPDPFEGPLRELGEFATHTFDISTLLGGYDESLLPENYAGIIASWRDVVLDFVREGKAPCERFGEKGGGMVIGKEGVRRVESGEYMAGRRERLMELAEKIDEKEGWDVLWVDVCRRFLMKGE